MPHLSLSFLGGFDVVLDAEPVTAFGADKARALLAYLAIEAGSPGAHPHRRSKLCLMFWPDLPEKKAAHNLSQTLLRLRRALSAPGGAGHPDFLIATPQDVQFNSGSDYDLDVTRFRERLSLVARHRHPDAAHCAECHRWLAEAVALYKGDLLAGLLVPGSVAFEEWRLVEQEELHRQAWEALERLTAYHAQRGEFERVQEYARRQLTLEPWREEAHIQLMQALALSGQTAAALRQYESYQHTLAEELGLEPSEEVTRLCEQIRTGEFAQQPTARGDVGEIIWLSSQGERRQVTALVCSRVAPTTSPDSAEELDEQATACSHLCENIYHRFGGQRARRQGNACVVYFGYPQAYEDAARRAVYSALAIATAPAGEYGAARIGVHTGIMLVGERHGTGWQDRDLAGHALEIARDCQRLSAAGEVLITEETRRLLYGAFDLDAVDRTALTAGGQPLPLHRVLGASNAPSRLDWLAQTQRLAEFSGRADELHRLEAAYAAVLTGAGQAVLLRGEPGIGKSRLLWELKQRIPIPGGAAAVASYTRAAVRWLSVHCQPHYQNTSLYPIIGLIEQLLGFKEDDSADVRREQITGMLAWYGLDRPTFVWLLSLLLNLPTATPAPVTITPAQREQMRTLFVALVQKRAMEQSLVLEIENLHWSDPSTVEWLGRSLAALTTAPCLLLLTARPEFSPVWLANPDVTAHLHMLDLKPLRPEAAAGIVAGLAGEGQLDEGMRRQIITQADGVPLFIEELTKTLLERSVTLIQAAAVPSIPVTLLDLLVARLDRLGPARETAQWAAVLGREFDYSLLQACAPYAEERLQNDLIRLVEAELIAPVVAAQQGVTISHKGKAGATAPARYEFKHALVQQAAYNSLLKRTRQVYHRRTAETLATRFPQLGKTQPEVLAQHYAEAGMSASAVDLWLQAGEQATAQGATVEARTFFDRALAAVQPEDYARRWRALVGREVVFNLRAERTAQGADIDALLALAETLSDDTRRGQALLRQMRYGLLRQDYPLALRAAAAARVVAQRLGDDALDLYALAVQASAHTSLGERDVAWLAVVEIQAKLPRVADEGVQAYALSGMAIYYHDIGDLARAVQLWQEASQKGRRVGDSRREGRAGINIGFAYNQLGMYAQARTTLEAVRALAEAIGEQGLYAATTDYLSYTYWCSGDRRQARVLAEADLHEYRTTVDSPYAQAMCLTYLGIYLAAEGEWAAAAAHSPSAAR